MEVHDSQLLKGVLGLVLLRLIAEGDAYGYELVERVHSLGLTEVPDGSVYPALNRLEREGYVTSYLVPSSSGPARKYYRVTPEGEQTLDAKREAWLALVEALEPLFGTRRAVAQNEGSPR
jgi:PadR family transcriptional regulator PadR